LVSETKHSRRTAAGSASKVDVSMPAFYNANLIFAPKARMTLLIVVHHAKR